MDINYELLRTFVAIGKARTFAEASIARRVTASSVSQQMKALEGQLGTRLFERVGRRARLTAEGRRLLEALSAPLEDIERALNATNEAGGTPAGKLKVGSPRTFGAHWLRPRLPALLSSLPGLELTIEFDVPSVLERRLADGQLDLAILSRPPELPGIEGHPLFVETFVAVGRAPAVDPRRLPRTADDFSRLRYLVFDRDQAMHSQWWKAGFGRRTPLPTQIACEVASLDELLALAERGAGVCVLPDFYVAEALRRRRIRKLEPEGGRPARNTLFLSWRTRAVPTARFLAVREALQDRRP